MKHDAVEPQLLVQFAAACSNRLQNFNNKKQLPASNECKRSKNCCIL